MKTITYDETQCPYLNPGEAISKRYEYRVWIDMNRRCGNSRRHAYKWYGAKGITVCESWKNSFINFLNDMGPRPEGTSLDRIDVSKGYFKENCRWTTMVEQQRNRSNNKLDPERAKDIIEQVSSGKSKDTVAAEFGISRTMVRKIVDGKCWSEQSQ